MTIGKRILELRKRQNITQVELVKRTGMKREYISSLENDHLKNPTWNTIKKIAGAFYMQDVTKKQGIHIPMTAVVFLITVK